MALLRTYDSNGKIQFVIIKPDMFYFQCKHSDYIFSIGSICRSCDEDCKIDALEWYEDCLDEKCECGEHYGDMPAVTLEVVRNILAEKSHRGFTLDVKRLVAKFGGDRLSDINPSNYEAIIDEVEMIGKE